MNRIFRGFCINRFGIGPLHYILSRSDFGFEFSEIFVFEKRLPDSMIRGVGDSPYQWYAESATLQLNDTGSRLLNFLKENSLYRWYGESSTPWISDAESRRLPVSLSRRVADSGYHWVGSRRLRVSVIRGVAIWKKICLASIFSTLNVWSMTLKDQVGQKLVREVIYYQNWII